MTAILGISAHFHDAAAALLVDGKIVAAAEEERFTRRKHDPSFPRHSIEFCLKKAGLSRDDVAVVAYYEKPILKFDRLLETALAHAPRGFFRFHDAMSEWLSSKLWMRRTLRQQFPGRSTKLMFCQHHESHAASAFYPSPFEESTILTVDGVGEWSTTAIGIGRGNRLQLIEHLEYPHSLGLFYSAMTAYCGFEVNEGEYKLMGLAAFGVPRFRDQLLEHVVQRRGDGSFRLNPKFFSFSYSDRMFTRALEQLLEGPPRSAESTMHQRYCDVAASAQAVLEMVLLDLAQRARERTGLRKLTLAGGVALNGVATAKLLESGLFDDIWIQPAAGDSGGALGAALLAWHELQGCPRDFSNSTSQANNCWGPALAEAEIETLLQQERRAASRLQPSELIAFVAQELARGKVVGWCDGRMEFGPRALGHRSILADPRRASMQQRLNEKIKFREEFRPFAPAVLAEHAERWFELPRGAKSPYMMLVGRVRSLQERSEQFGPSDTDASWRDGLQRADRCWDLPAITHVDRSARIQTVDSDDHPRFHALLTEFERLTGSPVLLNTSFNLRGEPIVCSAHDALRTFDASGIDWLVLGDFVVGKTSAAITTSEVAPLPGVGHALA